MARLNVFDDRRRLSLLAREKKIERNTREKTHKEREREANEKRKKSSSSLSLFLLFASVSLSLSLSLLFFFWLSFLSLKSFSLSRRSVSRFPLSRNSDESARGFQRAPLCCSETRASTREKRERERKRRERERERTLFTDGSFSPLLFLSAITARN